MLELGFEGRNPSVENWRRAFQTEGTAGKAWRLTSVDSVDVEPCGQSSLWLGQKIRCQWWEAGRAAGASGASSAWMLRCTVQPGTRVPAERRSARGWAVAPQMRCSPGTSARDLHREEGLCWQLRCGDTGLGWTVNPRPGRFWEGTRVSGSHAKLKEAGRIAPLPPAQALQRGELRP